MSALSAGTLDKRVRFQRPFMVKDSLGAPRREWVDTVTVWANIEPLSARDLISAQRISNEISHIITVRFQSAFSNAALVSEYRALYKNRVFRIFGAINEGEQGVLVTLWAAEGLDDGQT